MAITHVGTFAGVTDTASTLAYTTHTLGDLVVLTDATSSASAGATSVSGGGCAKWVEVTDARVSSSSGAVTVSSMWIGTVTTVGNVTVTVTRQSNAGNCQIDIDQFSAGLGANTAWSVQSADASTGTSSTTMTFPSLTPTSAALYVGYAVTPNTGNTPSSIPSGFVYNVDSYFTSVRCYNLNVTSTVAPTARQQSGAQYTRAAALLTAGLPVTTDTKRFFLAA